MTHLYFMRHAQDNYDQDTDGMYRDLGLSPEGIDQANRLRDRLLRTSELKPDVFISSPERRAKETAEIIAPALGQPVTLDADFEEWRSDDGSMTPTRFMELWNEVPKSQRAYYRWYEGGENRVEFALRVHQALNRIIQEHAGKTIAIMTHGAFLQMTFPYFFGFGEASIERALPEMRRTSITHWVQIKDRWTLERSNDYYHLL
jgi:2,3-bisphosphoglycerate-dependent phosphoglycerate mutase